MAQKWHDRLFGGRLVKCDTLSKTDDLQEVPTADVLAGADVVGVYFSFANINSRSDDFIEKLKGLHERLNEKICERKRLEVVQVVMWAHNDVYSDFENSHRDSLLGLPWYAMPYSEIDLKVGRVLCFSQCNTVNQLLST